MTQQLIMFPRDEFIQHRFDYRPGEHCAFIAPTQSGKTTLMFDLLNQVCTPKLQAVILVEKPRDRTVELGKKLLQARVVRNWPPVEIPWISRVPRAYMVWPKTEFDPEIDRPRKARVFRRAMLGSYKSRKKRIVVADEAFKICNLLGLEAEFTEILASGSSMDCGEWAATQKPSHVSTWLYGNADHVFLSYDADLRNRKRFGEIGGVDAKLVSDTTLKLSEFQWLYIRRRGRVMCIIDK